MSWTILEWGSLPLLLRSCSVIGLSEWRIRLFSSASCWGGLLFTTGFSSRLCIIRMGHLGSDILSQSPTLILSLFIIYLIFVQPSQSNGLLSAISHAWLWLPYQLPWQLHCQLEVPQHYPTNTKISILTHTSPLSFIRDKSTDNLPFLYPQPQPIPYL